jgi:hypothetical protein
MKPAIKARVKRLQMAATVRSDRIERRLEKVPGLPLVIMALPKCEGVPSRPFPVRVSASRESGGPDEQR